MNKIYKFDLVNLKNQILETKFYFDKQKALEAKRLYLAKFLVGYNEIYDNMSENEHLKILQRKSLIELEQIANEAYFNNELDYKFIIYECKI